MDFDMWEKWYNEILDDFGFSREYDEFSAKTLNNILKEENNLSLEELTEYINLVKNTNKFIVFGAGPSLKEHINKIRDALDDYILIAADGATSALIEERIIPEIITTDLDGKLDDLLAANDRGSIVVIHAHGNNFNQIVNYTPYFNNILGTTQSKPFENIYNFGGFTDGDRAIFLAIALGAKEIILAGMDFGTVVTRYSRPNLPDILGSADEIKVKKLEYAEKLTKWIKNNEKINLINLKD